MCSARSARDTKRYFFAAPRSVGRLTTELNISFVLGISMKAAANRLLLNQSNIRFQIEFRTNSSLVRDDSVEMCNSIGTHWSEREAIIFFFHCREIFFFTVFVGDKKSDLNSPNHINQMLFVAESG